MLTKHRIKDGVLTLRTAKTGTDVRVPLPSIALDALAALKTDNYYFWSGRGTAKSCVSVYQRAVELLLAGLSLDQVSVLLGHQSIRVTERHYSPWVKSRQDQLEAAVRRTF